MAFPTGWGRKCVITIPAAQISGSNANFPVLVTEANLLTEMLDGGANSALNGGGDVRVTEDSAGTVQVPLEIVTFVTGASPSVEMYIKLPTVDTGADKTYYVWYKKSGEVQPLVTAAYGRNAVWSDYELVSHDLSTDSTGNNSLTQNGAPTTGATNPVGGNNAVTFDGVNDYIKSSAIAYSGDQTPLWLQIWAKPVTVSDFSGVLGLFDSTDSFNWQSLHQQFNNIGVITRQGGNMTSANTADPTTAMVAGAWQKFDGVFALSNDRRAYIDGGSKGIAATGFTWSNTLNNITIGRFGDSSPSSYFNGTLYGARVRLSTPTDTWITTEYNNQSNPAAFGIAGTPQAVGGGSSFSPFWAINSNVLIGGNSVF